MIYIYIYEYMFANFDGRQHENKNDIFSTNYSRTYCDLSVCDLCIWQWQPAEQGSAVVLRNRNFAVFKTFSILMDCFFFSIIFICPGFESTILIVGITLGIGHWRMQCIPNTTSYDRWELEKREVDQELSCSC